MKELEQKILKSFIKYEGKEVKGLDLIICWTPDCWPDFEGSYTCEVMESKDNGRVWEVICTKSGNVKDTFEL